MIRHQKGHKNSKGEKAEWVIISHKDGHIISSHTSKAAAEKHLKDIQKFKHMKESIEWTEDKLFDYLVAVEDFDIGDLNDFFRYHSIEKYVDALNANRISENEVVKYIKNIIGYEIKESAEDGHISRWDRNKIFKGIAPSWAKKASVLGPKPKRPDTANTPSEIAMKRVTDPKYRKYTETDLLNDRNAEKDANQRIANIIAKKIDLPISATATSIIIQGDNITYEIIPYGFVYKVRTRKNNTDTEMYDFESIREIIEFIKNGTLGESMKLDEAKEILKKNGAKLVKENHEDDIRANTNVFDFIYTLKTDFRNWIEAIDSKAKDYINGHVDDKDWRDFVEKCENDSKFNRGIYNKMIRMGDVLRTLVNR